MRHDQYEIEAYRPEFEPQVLDLLELLWGGQGEVRRKHLQWKYADNPYAESPLAVVARLEGQVVGFRGFFALRYHIPGRAPNVMVLAPGDTVVHADHRRKGLSAAMIRLAMQPFATQQGMYLNMTCNAKALGGYLKAGFVPLTQRTYLSLSSRPWLLNYAYRALPNLRRRGARIGYGRSGNILVERTPRPADMARVVAQGVDVPAALQLCQDETFFDWRFGSPMSQFVFYYHFGPGAITAYLVVKLSSDLQQGEIVDCAESQAGSLEATLRHVIDARHFVSLSIYHFCADEALRRALDDLSFRPRRPLKPLLRRPGGDMPVLIRPLREDHTAKDFDIAGLDLCRVENWRLKGVCSDGV